MIGRRLSKITYRLNGIKRINSICQIHWNNFDKLAEDLLGRVKSGESCRGTGKGRERKLRTDEGLKSCTVKEVRSNPQLNIVISYATVYRESLHCGRKLRIKVLKNSDYKSHTSHPRMNHHLDTSRTAFGRARWISAPRLNYHMSLCESPWGCRRQIYLYPHFT